jgi:hypothetical protein
MLFPHCFESRVGVEGGVLVSCYSIAYVGASGEPGDRSGVLKFSMGCMAEAQTASGTEHRGERCTA